VDEGERGMDWGSKVQECVHRRDHTNQTRTKHTAAPNTEMPTSKYRTHRILGAGIDDTRKGILYAENTGIYT
jgi:hypothetical protein